MISENLLEKYARLIVRTGANVQKGQVVMLTISVELSEFAALLIEECYKAGAKKVNVEWQSDAQKRLNFTYADEEVLCESAALGGSKAQADDAGPALPHIHRLRRP